MRTPNINAYFTKDECIFILNHEGINIDINWNLKDIRKKAHNLYHFDLTKAQQDAILWDAAFNG